MADPLPCESPLIARAQRLLAISAAAPLIVFLTAGAALILYGRPYSAHFVPVLAGEMIFLIWIAWMCYWKALDAPHAWKINSVVAGCFNVIIFAPAMFGIWDYSRFQLDVPTFAVAVVLFSVGIFLIGWLPARLAARLILDDLPPEVVNSSLVIPFRSRVRSVGPLHVAPGLIVFKWRQGNDVTQSSYPLSDVSALALHVEAHNGEFRVPGAAGKKIQVKAGEVLVIDLPDGRLVYPARDGHRLKRFIEDRRAVILAE